MKAELPEYAEPVIAAAWMAAIIAEEHAGASADSPIAAAIFTALLPIVIKYDGGEDDNAPPISNSFQ